MRSGQRFLVATAVVTATALAVGVVNLVVGVRLADNQRASCERGNKVRSALRLVVETEMFAIAPAAELAQDPVLRARLAELLPRLSDSLASPDLQPRNC